MTPWLIMSLWGILGAAVLLSDDDPEETAEHPMDQPEDFLLSSCASVCHVVFEKKASFHFQGMRKIMI